MDTVATPIRRNILITLVMIAISVILCTLGFNTASQPIDSIAVIWPGAILHAVGTILFGGWGVVATIVAGMIVDVINVGSLHAIFGYAIPDFLQAIIPAIYYRSLFKRNNWNKTIFSFRPFFIFAVVLPNVVGAIVGTLILHSSTQTDLWFPMSRWLIANIPIALILGWPLLRFLGPVMVEEGWIVKDWWK